MLKITTNKIATAGIVAGLYVILSMMTLPIIGGALQLRISEGLCLLPLLIPESTIGLFVGCILSNLLGGCAPLDVVLGSLITLIAGILTFLTGKIIKKDRLKVLVGGLFPVLLNAFLLPIVWIYAYGYTEYTYIIQALILVASQSLSVYLVGGLAYKPCKRMLNKIA